jgi:hypothetical protein
MRIHGDPRNAAYPIVRTVTRTDARAAQREHDAHAAAGLQARPVTPAQPWTPPPRARVDVVAPGYSLRAQRAIDAYTQHDVQEQRTQYAALLGVDVYA